MTSIVETTSRDQESLQLKSLSRHSRTTFRLNVARFSQLVLALVVSALSGSIAQTVGLHYAHIFTLSVLTIVSQTILLFYINVVPLWASRLYVHAAHVLLEIVVVILSIFTFFLLIGQCDAWSKLGDSEISSADKAAAMREMSIQAPPMTALGAATCVSGVQTILSAGILITFVPHIRP